ncbi:MAG: type III secretion system chaperone [Verrucomicrobium sp.]
MTDLVNSWIASLCVKQGLGAGKLDEFGQWHLVFEQEHRCGVYLPSDSPHLFFVAEICPIPIHAREAFYASLLSHNLALQETEGACFAIDQADETVWLNYGQPLSTLDAPRFEDSLGAFLELAMKWHARFRDAVVGSDLSVGLPDRVDSNFPGVRI